MIESYTYYDQSEFFIRFIVPKEEKLSFENYLCTWPINLVVRKRRYDITEELLLYEVIQLRNNKLYDHHHNDWESNFLLYKRNIVNDFCSVCKDKLIKLTSGDCCKKFILPKTKKVKYKISLTFIRMRQTLNSFPRNINRTLKETDIQKVYNDEKLHLALQLQDSGFIEIEE